jgi:hypothetical protein
LLLNPHGFILVRMNELDELWSQMLASALENARASGRHDVADYLALRATNDALRQTAVRWLFESLTEIAGEANRYQAGIAVERIDSHNFQHRGSNIVGSMLRIRQGVRCLTAEAGWTRTPKDGFMRGGALAFARIRHFGMPKSNAELRLLKRETIPVWAVDTGANAVRDFDSHDLREHFRIFLGA